MCSSIKSFISYLLTLAGVVCTTSQIIQSRDPHPILLSDSMILFCDFGHSDVFFHFSGHIHLVSVTLLSLLAAVGIVKIPTGEVLIRLLSFQILIMHTNNYQSVLTCH